MYDAQWKWSAPPRETELKSQPANRGWCWILTCEVHIRIRRQPKTESAASEASAEAADVVCLLKRTTPCVPNIPDQGQQDLDGYPNLDKTSKQQSTTNTRKQYRNQHEHARRH
jgi:hypothetical protein